MKTVSLALAVSALLGSSAMARTLTIALDVSGSNPLVSSPRYAGIAAAYVQDKVAALQPGDIVSLHTLADRSIANLPSEHIQITRRDRADKVAARIAQYVAGMASRHFDGQGSTNILSFFEFGQFDCGNDGEILLVTDGIESSSAMDPDMLLAGRQLPKPDPGLLAACTVTMFGLGQATAGNELSPLQVRHLRTAWTNWMSVAGARYTAIINP